MQETRPKRCSLVVSACRREGLIGDSRLLGACRREGVRDLGWGQAVHTRERE